MDLLSPGTIVERAEYDLMGEAHGRIDDGSCEPGPSDGKTLAAHYSDGMRKGVTTVHLGQYTDEHANTIAGELEKAGIVWWYKQPGYFSSIWEKGTRLFVDADRLDDAKAIAERVLEEQPEAPGGIQ
jgi:hypothetical protein